MNAARNILAARLGRVGLCSESRVSVKAAETSELVPIYNHRNPLALDREDVNTSAAIFAKLPILHDLLLRLILEL